MFSFLPDWLKYGGEIHEVFMKYIMNHWVIGLFFSLYIFGGGIWFLISEPLRRSEEGGKERKNSLHCMLAGGFLHS